MNSADSELKRNFSMDKGFQVLLPFYSFLIPLEGQRETLVTAQTQMTKISDEKNTQKKSSFEVSSTCFLSDIYLIANIPRI
jgi:hypothetical protein